MRAIVLRDEHNVVVEPDAEMFSPNYAKLLQRITDLKLAVEMERHMNRAAHHEYERRLQAMTEGCELSAKRWEQQRKEYEHELKELDTELAAKTQYIFDIERDQFDLQEKLARYEPEWCAEHGHRGGYRCRECGWS